MIKIDYTSSNAYLIKRDKPVSVYDRNIQSLAIKLFKVEQNLSSPMLCNIF